MAALIAEVVWIRRAALAFGSTTFAMSTVLAVFFGGLAAGSFVFGERSPRIARPLRLYVVLELALAVAVLATLPLFDLAEALFGRVYQAGDAPPFLLAATRCALVALVLLPPTFLMGGTLPLFVRQCVGDTHAVGRTVGFLYGLNTVGAAAGAALCGFVLLPSLGMRLSLLVAAVLDLVAAGVVAFAGWHAAVTIPAVRPLATTARRSSAAAPAASVLLLAFLFFVSGAVALGNEILWTRFLALVLRTTVSTYTIALTVTLLGIVVGSWLAAVVADRSINHARWFGVTQAASALLALAIPLLPPALWHGLGAWAYGLLLLPPAALSGAALPLAVRMAVTAPALAGAGAGRMLAANTLGGISGSLAVGLIALPQLGLQATLLCTTGCAVLAALLTWWRLDRTGPSAARVALSAAAVLAWLALPRALGTQIPRDYLTAHQEGGPSAAAGQLVDYREGRAANLAVIRRQGTLHLEADRWWQGQDRPTHQMLAAHVPLLLHAAPRQVLIVGAGAGQTPANVLVHDVERLDCIDIEPVAFDLIRAHFAHAWMDDPRVRLLREDGRSYIAHTSARYDVISLEVGQLFRPGVADFYSADFYQRARARLLPGGILSQFVPLPFLSVDALRRVVASFRAAFPHSVLWYNTAELLLLGINADRIVLRAERLQSLTAEPRINAALRYSYWGGPGYWLNQPHVFLAGFLVGPRGLDALARGAPVERDDHPTLGRASRDASALQANEMPILDALRPHLESVTTITEAMLPAHTLAAVMRVRERNLGDLHASALLRRVDSLVAARDDAALAALLRQAREANPDSVQAHRFSGDLELFHGRASQAEAHYRRALALHPDDPGSHLGLARLLHTQRRTAEAVEHYRTALAQRQGDSATYIAFGGALAELGDTASAEQSFATALALDPTSAEAHNNLAVALSQRGDIPGARRHLEAAVRLRPDYVEARRNLETLRR